MRPTHYRVEYLKDKVKLVLLNADSFLAWPNDYVLLTREELFDMLLKLKEQDDG